MEDSVVLGMAGKMEEVDMATLVVLEAADQEAVVMEVALEGSVDQELVDMAAEAADTVVEPVDAHVHWDRRVAHIRLVHLEE